MIVNRRFHSIQLEQNTLDHTSPLTFLKKKNKVLYSDIDVFASLSNGDSLTGKNLLLLGANSFL